MKKDAKGQRQFHILLMALTLAFALFILLKLGGLFDFTSSYGITHITSSVSDGEGALMIDGDDLTYWNTYDRTIEPGDRITVYFDDTKEISSLQIDMDEASDPDKEAGEGTLCFSYKDGKDWKPVEASRGDAGRYTFVSPVTTKAIRIEISDVLTEDEAATLSWRIKEIAIDEE